jgi:class 3 adenylate cyclase
MNNIIRFSISAKIIGSMTFLLGIMLIVITVIYYKANNVDAELSLLSKTVIPISNTLANIDIHTLEQEKLFERIFHLLDSTKKNEKQIKKEVEKFNHLGKQVDLEIITAQKILKRNEIHFKTKVLRNDVITLTKLIPMIDFIKKQHQEFHDHVKKMIELKQQKKIERFHFMGELLSKKIDDFAKSRNAALVIIEEMSKHESEEVLEGELSIHNVSLVIAIITSICGILIAPFITKRIVKPLNEMNQAAIEISKGNWDISIPVITKDEVGQLSQSFNEMANELQKKERIKETFGKYVDPRIVEQLLSDQGEYKTISNEKKRMTIFFSDIVSFSTISESLTPGGLVNLINKYFSLASEPIMNHKGVIDKYIGDAIMAFWGPPFTNEKDHAQYACLAALEQFEQISKLQSIMPDILGFRKGLPEIDIRIGLCTGDVVAGNIGSDQSQSFTVMGDTVNIAARLESANKQYGTHILMNSETHRLISDQFVTREIDRIIVVGKLEPVNIFELISLKDQAEPSRMELIQYYESALSFYRNQNWDQCRMELQKCLEINSTDGPSLTLQKRLETLSDQKIDHNWDGVWRLTHK